MFIINVTSFSSFRENCFAFSLVLQIQIEHMYVNACKRHISFANVKTIIASVLLLSQFVPFSLIGRRASTHKKKTKRIISLCFFGIQFFSTIICFCYLLFLRRMCVCLFVCMRKYIFILCLFVGYSFFCSVFVICQQCCYYSCVI